MRMNEQYSKHFHFLRFALGIENEAPADMDWQGLYAFAMRQTLVGVVFDGVQRMPKGNAPQGKLLMDWLGESMKIRSQNAKLDKASVEIYNAIGSRGYRGCILKGQGNSILYPNPATRTPGDVDVWVNASRNQIRALADELVADGYKMGEESLTHIEMTSPMGIPVEIHSTPAIMNNPIHNHRLQKWLKRVADLQCSNIVSLPNDAGNIAVPTASFNVVYQLYHLFHHYFYEGVGLRQIVDYYYVVKNLPRMSQIGTDALLQRDLKHLGLWNFAGAVMYVLHEVLGMEEQDSIAPFDVQRGGMLLEEILAGGNFGKHDERYGFSKNAIGHNLQRLQRDMRLARYYPTEALAEPFFRMWHFFWRMKNK